MWGSNARWCAPTSTASASGCPAGLPNTSASSTRAASEPSPCRSSPLGLSRPPRRFSGSAHRRTSNRSCSARQAAQTSAAPASFWKASTRRGRVAHPDEEGLAQAVVDTTQLQPPAHENCEQHEALRDEKHQVDEEEQFVRPEQN